MKKIFIYILFVSIFVLTGCDRNTVVVLNYSNYSELHKAFEVLELGFEYDKEINNPYNSSEITMDAIITFNDKTVSVPLFYYESFERTLDNDVEKLNPTNNDGWRLRYTPLETGTYDIRVKVNHNKKTKSLYLGRYFINPGDKDGNLQVSSDKTHLEFSNGNSFVGIGHNLCGWEWAGVDNMQGTYEYDRWFTELVSNGANMTQFDLCEGDNIEWTNIDYELPTSTGYDGVNSYNQQAAWKMDYKVKTATDLGLYFRFTLFHWEDFDNEKTNFPDWGWERNPYNAINGGPVDNVSEFFKDTTSKQYVKDYLRYCVSRWGYSTNLMAWELWNEIDAPEICWKEGENYHSNQVNVAEWHQEMGQYMKELDPNKHLITTSFASSDLGDAIWKLEEIDITTFHRYTMYNNSVEGLYESHRALYNIINSRLQMYNKPVIGGEFALSPGGDIQRENDLDGIAFHNQVWSSIFSGSFGTAMHWTWGSYIDRNDLYYHYNGLSKFLIDEDLNEMEFSNNIRANENYYFYQMSSNNRAMLWIRDAKYDFYDVVVDKYEPQPISNAKVELSGLINQKYTVLYYDTLSGKIVNQETIDVIEGKFELKISEFVKDIAIKVLPTNEVYSYINIGAGRPLDDLDVCGDTVSMYASGVELAGMSDDGMFAYVMVKGDFVYTAKISEVTYLSQNAKAGIMIRQSLSSNSKMLYLAMNGFGSYNLFVRYASIPSASGWNYIGSGSYFRVERINDTFNVYVSANNIEYILVDTIEFSKISDELYVGLAACASNNLGYNDALFENVKLER